MNKLVGALVAVKPFEGLSPEHFTWGKPYEILEWSDGLATVVDDLGNLRFISSSCFKVWKLADQKRPTSNYLISKTEIKEE